MEQQKLQLKAVLKMVEALAEEAHQAARQPPGIRPEKMHGAGRQVNELVQWVQQELNVRLPIAPLPDDPDPFTLSLTVAQLKGALRVLAGEEVAEEEIKEKEKREPILRIRDQKSPVEFSEVVITSTKELTELLRTGLPEWVKQIIAKATGKAEEAVKKAAEEVKAVVEAETVRLEGEEAPKSERVTVRLGERLSERLENFGELLEESADELEEVEEELQEAVEEGELTEERKAQLEAKRQKIKQRIKEAMQSLQQALGE